MFDIGWGELVLVGLVALIVVGPKELPTVLRTAGQWMGKVKRMASEFQGQFQEALREAEVSDLKQTADDLTGELKGLTDYDPMAGSDKVKGDTDESDWDEPSFETPEHETLEHTDLAAEGASDTETSAEGGAEPATSEPDVAEPAVAEEPVTEETADIERAPAAPIAAVESAPAEPAEGAPSADTPPPKQAGGKA